MKKVVALTLAAILILSVLPVSLAAEESDITLSGKTEIEVGETAVWTATSEQYGTFRWVAGYPAVATVDENGAVTGHRPGACHITAIAPNGERKTVTVHVVSYDVEEIQLAGRTVIGVGETVGWTASTLPEGSLSGITWAAGYPAVATVDGSGNITGHRAGDCHITATASVNGVKKTVTVHVREVEDLQLAGKTHVAVGETVTWTAKALPEGLTTDITWAAGYPAVATVDENGVITAHREGDCHITATASNGVKKTVTLHVMDARSAEIAENYPDVLASYDSPHTAIAARTNNLILACKEIDGTVVQPGEVFSFNQTVGERTAEKGYREAIVYTGGDSKPAIGGGVCQVASTIYMCTLLADLEVVQRTEHMFVVTYVPLGMDATIYWGSLDYKFRNTTSHPIMILASVSDGCVHIKLLGRRESDVTVKMTYNMLSGSRYGPCTVQTYKNRYDAAGNLLGTEKCAYSSYRAHVESKPEPKPEKPVEQAPTQRKPR